jgi:hypothetical protein
VFGRGGLILHGETEVGKRKDLVRRFQTDDDVPFFVLSLKAGGAGLNLTAASHVIHSGGIRPRKTRPQTAPSASGRPRTCWCTNSSAAAPWRRRSTR